MLRLLQKINHFFNQVLITLGAFFTYFLGLALSTLLLKIYRIAVPSHRNSNSCWHDISDSHDLTKMY